MDRREKVGRVSGVMNRKSLTVTIENLSNGQTRATGRQDGRTVAWKDGTDAKSLLAKIMAKTCGAHRVGDNYDLTYIELNAAAMAVFNSK